jgi:hypothetical protein
METLHEQEFVEALERITPQWLAGFFDGEGCITCVRYRGMPSLRVDLIQCDANILILIGAKFGRSPYAKPGRSPRHRTGYVLGFVGKSALPLLQYIQPHVVLKRKLVDWGVEMAKLHGETGGNRRWGKGFLKPEVRQRREELLRAMRNENQSGRLPKPN